MRSLKLAALVAASWFVIPTHAQQLSGESSILPEASYSDSEVTVEQVLGYPMGTKITSPADMSRYFEALKQAYPKQVKLLEYGKSWEGRTLYYAVISSERNMADFDGFMQGMQSLADPRKTDSDDAEQLIDQLPGSIWLSYGVHGNEISSPEAAMMTAYHLLHDQREQTQQWLDNTPMVGLVLWIVTT